MLGKDSTANNPSQHFQSFEELYNICKPTLLASRDVSLVGSLCRSHNVLFVRNKETRAANATRAIVHGSSIRSEMVHSATARW